MEKLAPRVKNGVESGTHFLYTDSKGREWSVVDFHKMMSGTPEYDHMDFGYKWEGMYFGDEEVGQDQFRGSTAKEIIDGIESMITNQ